MYQPDQESEETQLDKSALMQYIDIDGRYDNTLCNEFKSGVNNKLKISSYGFLATVLSCSVIVGFTEQPCSEGSKYTSKYHRSTSTIFSRIVSRSFRSLTGSSRKWQYAMFYRAVNGRDN